MYSKDPNGKWKSKDAAIYLVTSMAVKGQTAKVIFVYYVIVIIILLFCKCLNLF